MAKVEQYTIPIPQPRFKLELFLTSNEIRKVLELLDRIGQE